MLNPFNERNPDMSKIQPCSGGDCIELVNLPCGGKILYSNRRPTEAILVDRDEWTKFVAEVKQGKYDIPEPAPAERRSTPMSAAEMRARVAAEEAR